MPGIFTALNLFMHYMLHKSWINVRNVQHLRNNIIYLRNNIFIYAIICPI